MPRFASVLLGVVLLSFGQVAVGQMPVVENLYGAMPVSEIPVLPEDAFADIPGTERTINVPPGKVFITWHLWAVAKFPDVWIRPSIGNSAPDIAVRMIAPTAGNGNWLTTTDGGEITVKLQVSGHSSTLDIEEPNLVAWTVIVFPDAKAGVPAVSSIGMVVMVVLLLGAGAVLLKRRQVAS